MRGGLPTYSYFTHLHEGKCPFSSFICCMKTSSKRPAPFLPLQSNLLANFSIVTQRIPPGPQSRETTSAISRETTDPQSREICGPLSREISDPLSRETTGPLSRETGFIQYQSLFYPLSLMNCLFTILANLDFVVLDHFIPQKRKTG